MEPFISTDFCRSYHLIRHYINSAYDQYASDVINTRSLKLPDQFGYDLAYALRDVERYFFLSANQKVSSDRQVIGVSSYYTYEFDFTKEESFDKELFINQMILCFDKFKLTNLSRDFKIRLITNDLYSFGDIK